MNIERFSMENKIDAGGNNSQKKHTPRYVIGGLFTMGSLFLSSCAEKITGGNQDIDTSQVTPPIVNVEENNPTSNIETSIPAIIPTEEGQIVDIVSSNYPTSPDNFIIDTRTNEEKMALIRSWAPDDVEKEISLYDAEFKRMGVNPNDIEYKASIVDGKSWTLYPKDKKTKACYIVSINNIIRPSIDLFGYLDKSPEDDFFNLETVNIGDAEAIGDKSGWFVFAEVTNGNVTKWLDAVHDRINTVEAEPTPTPEPSYIMNADLPIMDMYEFHENYDQIAKEFDNVTLEDITSGKLLKYELAYISKNPIFTDEVINCDLDQNYVQADAGWKINMIVPAISRDVPEHIYKPETRPLKIISYYKFQDEKLFSEIGIDPREYEGVPEWPIWMVTWAYRNPSGKTTLGHSLIQILEYVHSLETLKQAGQNFKLCPYYEYENVNYTDEKAKKINPMIAYILWKYYPNLQPDTELIDEWIKTREMPEKLQNDIFWLNPYPIYW